MGSTPQQCIGNRLDSSSELSSIPESSELPRVPSPVNSRLRTREETPTPVRKSARIGPQVTELPITPRRSSRLTANKYSTRLFSPSPTKPSSHCKRLPRNTPKVDYSVVIPSSVPTFDSDYRQRVLQTIVVESPTRVKFAQQPSSSPLTTLDSLSTLSSQKSPKPKLKQKRKLNLCKRREVFIGVVIPTYKSFVSLSKQKKETSDLACLQTPIKRPLSSSLTPLSSTSSLTSLQSSKKMRSSSGLESTNLPDLLSSDEESDGVDFLTNLHLKYSKSTLAVSAPSIISAPPISIPIPETNPSLVVKSVGSSRLDKLVLLHNERSETLRRLEARKQELETEVIDLEDDFVDEELTFENVEKYASVVRSIEEETKPAREMLKQDISNNINDVFMQDMSYARRAICFDLAEREVWKNDTTISSLPLWNIDTQNKWCSSIYKSMNASIQNQDPFPSLHKLFSHKRGYGNRADYLRVVRDLTIFATHPFTTDANSYQATLLISLIGQRISDPSSQLGLEDFHAIFNVIGVKKASLPVKTEPSSPGCFEVESLRVVSERDRVVCLTRLMSILKLKTAISLLVSPTVIGWLVGVFCRIAVSPTCSKLYRILHDGTSNLLQGDEGISFIFDEIFSLFCLKTKTLQLEVVRFIPNDTFSSRKLRQWLAYAFLDPPIPIDSTVVLSSYPKISAILQCVSQDIQRSSEATESENLLLLQTLYLMQIALTNLGPQISSQVHELFLLYRRIGEIGHSIHQKITSASTTRDRAKYVATELAHILEYQWRVATGQPTDEEYILRMNNWVTNNLN